MIATQTALLHAATPRPRAGAAGRAERGGHSTLQSLVLSEIWVGPFACRPVGECSYSLSMILGHPATHYCMKSDEPRTHHAVQPASQPAWPACGCTRSARLHAGAANQRRAKSLKQASQCSVLQLQRSRAARNRVVGHSQQAFLRRWWRHKSEALVRVWRRAKRTGSRLDGHHRAQISFELHDLLTCSTLPVSPSESPRTDVPAVERSFVETRPFASILSVGWS